MREQTLGPPANIVVVSIIAALLHLFVLASTVAAADRAVKAIEPVGVPKLTPEDVTAQPRPATFVHHRRVASCWRE